MEEDFWKNIGPARGQHPFAVQRPLDPRHFSWRRPVRVQLFVCGTVAEVFVDNRVALVTRMYNHRDGGLALFVEDGEASFESLTLKALP